MKNTKRISYSELVNRLDNGLILCNNMATRLYNTMELYSGTEFDYYDEEGNELTIEEYNEREEFSDYEPKEIYQYYIISDSDARYLAEYTDEIIYHDDELDIFVWGITHYGTSWTHVNLDIEEVC